MDSGGRDNAQRSLTSKTILSETPFLGAGTFTNCLLVVIWSKGKRITWPTAFPTRTRHCREN